MDEFEIELGKECARPNMRNVNVKNGESSIEYKPEKCPFKENGKLSKIFCLVLQGLNLPAGSDNPQNKILRGIRPRRTRSCGVSDPTELSLAVYQTPQNNGRVVYIL